MDTKVSTKTDGGYLLVLILVFGAIFFTLMTAFTGFVITQQELQQRNYDKERALDIAEAGLDYYKWYLAHFPNDTTHGTGGPGPYVLPYTHPEDGVIGEYSIEVSSTTVCGDVQSIDITSTGYAFDATSTTRTLTARYAQPTVAEYAYIINSNVWAGSDRTIVGPYHTNGVVRMDGTNNSTVTSGQENWTCDGSLSCAPGSTGSVVDGVYGDGPNFDLWSFPSTPINFTGLTVDLAAMRDRAENGGGLYIPPSGDFGYRLHFNSDNTVEVFIVDRTYNYWGYSSQDGWQTERHVIRDDDPFATFTIPAECPLIFVEDKVWLEGDINMRIAVAAADTDTVGVDHSMILNDDIVYTGSSSGLMAIAEEDVLVGLVVPDDMTLNGIFVAQNGHFGRNHYTTSGSRDVLSMHNGFVDRNTLTMFGSIVSNGRVGTKWNCSGTYCSGFETRFNSYDRDLVDNPPPLTPTVSDDYQFIEWLESD